MPPALAAIGITSVFLQTVITGALIGAALGGLTAAISGGDIGKGILFGAVGGAVGGALMYGLSAVTSSLGAGTTSAVTGAAPTNLGSAALNSAAYGTSMTEGALIQAGTSTASMAPAASGSFLSNTWKGLSSSFVSPEGLGQAVVAGGIQAYAGNVQQQRQLEALQKEKALDRQQATEDAAKAHEYAMAEIAASHTGASYRPLSEELAMMEAEKQALLAKVDAEIEGQEALKQQEFDRVDADRELIGSTASALKGTGTRRPSRSTDTLIDITNRAKGVEPEEMVG